MAEPFNADAYGPAAAKLLRDYRLFDLGPGTPVEAMRATLRAVTPGDLFQGKTIYDEYMAYACMSGLWLYFDFLPESHRISQSIPSTTGSLWHGIMHRREPDYPNAKYWLQKFSSHPIYEPLQDYAVQLAKRSEGAPEIFVDPSDSWDPFAFVDLCEQYSGQSSDAEAFCQQIQRREWELLFDYCYKRAIRR
ncbi:MAG: hypothetical protein JXR73_17130 [Candidatus Omnitrophica bacterium]|nr:hypothetical protein [Candidatus Omnitrophota bacterium]